jgi:hypothetical protein
MENEIRHFMSFSVSCRLINCICLLSNGALFVKIGEELIEISNFKQVLYFFLFSETENFGQEALIEFTLNSFENGFYLL